nr:MAG TPA: hypothetical protein [Bacteriophage sp.]
MIKKNKLDNAAFLRHFLFIYNILYKNLFIA